MTMAGLKEIALRRWRAVVCKWFALSEAMKPRRIKEAEKLKEETDAFVNFLRGVECIRVQHSKGTGAGSSD